MLEMFTVYFNPSDYPGKWVVRKWLVGKELQSDHEPLIVCDSLQEARSAIPEDLCCLQRNDEDEPQIVETWF